MGISPYPRNGAAVRVCFVVLCGCICRRILDTVVYLIPRSWSEKGIPGPHRAHPWELSAAIPGRLRPVPGSRNPVPQVRSRCRGRSVQAARALHGRSLLAAYLPAGTRSPLS